MAPNSSDTDSNHMDEQIGIKNGLHQGFFEIVKDLSSNGAKWSEATIQLNGKVYLQGLVQRAVAQGHRFCGRGARVGAAGLL